MVLYLLDFHENIRFSKTLNEYQEQLYPIQKTTISWFTKKIFIEQSRNIPMFNISGTLFRNIHQNFIGNFLRIYCEYLKGMFHEYSTNISLPDWYRHPNMNLDEFKNIHLNPLLDMISRKKINFSAWGL